MTEQQAKDYLHAHAAEHFTRDGSGKGYVCPICGSGSGKNGTGISSKDGGQHFTCWAGGCFTSADIIDIVALERGLTNAAYPQKLKAACAAFGISLDDPAPPIRPQPKPKKEETPTDYTAFFLQAHNNIAKTDYPQRRGLSAATLERFKIGYVEAWNSPKAPNAPATPRLIIPTSKESYLARLTREPSNDTEAKYAKMKVGKVHFFNIEALQQSDKPVFIVEGEIDAMSIAEAGGEAVALGSTSNIDKLLGILKDNAPAQPLIVDLDNDEAGSNASRKLTAGLDSLHISHTTAKTAGRYKDPNEALTKERQAFIERVTNATTEAEKTEAEASDTAEEYQHSAALFCLNDFFEGIKTNTPATPTGFTELDKLLDGGLYEGLHIVGAISSLGKTAFVMQIADQMAQGGHDVLIFSLEMSKYELMARSLSRNTSILTDAKGDTHNAKTARGITDYKRWKNYTEEENQIIASAIAKYSEYAQHIYIIEGVGDIGVNQIREAVERHIIYTGRKPVVFIDYLQILAPTDPRASDKQNMDKTVTELKRISRDNKLPIVAVSSVNRMSYNESISMEAMKESGAIEYSCDTMLGLQLKGVGGKDFDVNEAKKKTPRDVELVILKNRSAPTCETISYKFYAMFSRFEEVQQKEVNENRTSSARKWQRI